MLRFTREKILPLFLQSGFTVSDLAKKAQISHKTASRAVEGLGITAPVVAKIARALNFDAMKFLENPAQINFI